VRRARAGLAVAVLAAGLALGACEAVDRLPSATATLTPPPSTSEATVAPSEPPASALGVGVDPSLLELLPAEVEGVEIRADPDSAAEIAGDPILARDVSDVAVAVAFGPVATDDTVDYAVVALARLRPDVFSDAWFRDWRDTYDAEVCEQAGGVDTGRSEIALGELTIHRSTCAGGVVIHHAHLPAAGVVVSIQGAGPKDLGRAIMAALSEE
jgi:hypothetical protein